MTSLDTIIQNLGDIVLEVSGKTDICVNQATCDSRTIKPGDIFCAIHGTYTNGHNFIQNAIANGAKAIIVKEGISVSDEITVIRVSHDYRAFSLAAEATAGFPARNFKVLAVTGTNGKTTSAFLLREILNYAGFKTAMLGTIDYDLSNGQVIEADRTTPTPDKLQQFFTQIAKNKADYCVMEISSHGLDQQRIGTIKTHGAIFTNLTQDHLDYHITLENYFQAKKRLFEYHLTPGAPAVINADDPFGKRLADELALNLAKQQVISFSLRNPCTPVCVYVKDLKLSAKGTEFALSYPDGDWSITSPLAGLYNGYNVAGVAILAHELGLPYPTVKQALAACIGAPGRLQYVANRLNHTIYVDYAHTPDALQNVLLNLRKITQNRLIAVFGCGGDRDKTKRPIMGRIADECADVAIITSDNPRTERPDDIIADILKGIPASPHANILVEADRRKAIYDAMRMALPGDTILVAGKGHETYQEINGVHHHFSDAECIQDFC